MLDRLANVALTQNLQALRFRGEKSLHIETVEESGLSEASHSVFKLDLNKGPNEKQILERSERCSNRMCLNMGGILKFLIYSICP